MSGSVLLAVAAGLGLYQVTSLVLGPAATSRQFSLAVAAPSVDLDEISPAVLSSTGIVVGVLAPPAAAPAKVVVPVHRATPGPSPIAATPAVEPRATPAPRPTIDAPSKHVKPSPTAVVKHNGD